VAESLLHRNDRFRHRRKRKRLGLVATKHERLDPNERQVPPALLNLAPDFNLGPEGRHRQEREMSIVADPSLVVGQQGDQREVGDRVEEAVEIAAAERSRSRADPFGDIEPADCSAGGLLEETEMAGSRGRESEGCADAEIEVSGGWGDHGGRV